MKGENLIAFHEERGARTAIHLQPKRAIRWDRAVRTGRNPVLEGTARDGRHAVCGIAGLNPSFPIGVRFYCPISHTATGLPFGKGGSECPI